MTKILLDDNLRIRQALEFAQDEQYDKALFLLRNVNEYHADINKIVLLFKNYEFTCAREMFWRTVIKYAKTHTIEQDLLYVLGQEIVDFSTKDIFLDSDVPQRKQADITLLLRLNDDDEDIIYFDTDQQQLPEFLKELDRKAKFFDLNSFEYYDYLFSQAEMYNAEREFDREKDIINRMLNYNGDNVEILELLLISCVRRVEFGSQAFEIAEKIDGNTALSEEGLIAIAKTFADYQSKRQRCKDILLQLYENRENLEWSVVIDCMRIANNKLADEQTAIDFAQYIVSQCESANFQLLKKCIHVFFNFGKFSYALPVAKFILSEYSQDKFSGVILKYCNKHKDCNKSALISKIPDFSHFALPDRISRNIEKKLIKINEEQEKPIKCTKQLINDLEMYLMHLRSLSYEPDNAFIKKINLCAGIINNLAIPTELVPSYKQFILDYLSYIEGDSLISALLLHWLYIIDKEGKYILRTVTAKPYLLDMSMFRSYDEQRDKLLVSFYLASIVPLDRKSLEIISKQFDIIIKCDSDNEQTLSLSEMVYCILPKINSRVSVELLKYVFYSVDYERCTNLMNLAEKAESENNE